MLPDSCGSPRSHKHPKEQSQSPVQSPRRLASPRTPLQPGHGCAVPPRHCSPQPRLPCCSPLPAISPSPACRVRGTPELGCLGGCITQPGIGCAAPMALLIAEHPAPKSTALGWWGRGLGGQGGLCLLPVGCQRHRSFVHRPRATAATSPCASSPTGRSPPFPQDRLCPSHAVCPGTAGPGTTAACLPPRPAQHHEVGAQGVPDPHGHNWHQGGPTRGCPPSQCLSQHPPSASARARLWEGDLCLPRAATEAVPMGTVPMGTHEVWPWGGSAPASGSALLGEDP